MHAICDALLGALGEADIGHFFPNTDPGFSTGSRRSNRQARWKDCQCGRHRDCAGAKNISLHR
jgi:2C-methyl-D-erythritol 2,4-cyclodiphosphate synthase